MAACMEARAVRYISAHWAPLLVSLVIMMASTEDARAVGAFTECSADLVSTDDSANFMGSVAAGSTIFSTGNSYTTYLACGLTAPPIVMAYSMAGSSLAGKVVKCARRCVDTSAQGVLTYRWSINQDYCYCHADTVAMVANTSDSLQNCSNSIPTFLTAFSCVPTPSSGGGCTYGCVPESGCCVTERPAADEPVNIALIVAPTVVIAALLLLGLTCLIYLRLRRAKEKIDGEVGRQRLHRHGHTRDEVEAGSIADTILRPFLLPHRELQKSSKANADPFRGLDLSRSSSVGSFDDGSECPSCRETLLGSARTVTLRCRHQLHLGCIKGHIQHQLMNYEALDCPICHTPILETPSHQSEEGGRGMRRGRRDSMRSYASMDSLEEELQSAGAKGGGGPHRLGQPPSVVATVPANTHKRETSASRPNGKHNHTLT